jgi:lysozyme
VDALIRHFAQGGFALLPAREARLGFLGTVVPSNYRGQRLSRGERGAASACSASGDAMLNNPPIPVGYRLMKQLDVTPAMTAWAIQILRDSDSFPMHSTLTKVFERVTVLARVKWHAPDFQNHADHRGVTLYVPIQAAANAPAAEGIDVSGYQPTVDWAKVAASGIAFAFVKATEGTTLIDHTFANHWAGAKKARLLRGAYHFFRPKQDAAAQAGFFLAQLSDPGELPPVLDVEVVNGVALTQVAQSIGIWLDTVAASLGRPIVYTSPSFWNSLPGASEIASKADLWVANWGARVPAGVHGWSKWTFWQFTNKATISGIPGTADVDEDRFSGSLADLLAYSSGYTAARCRRAS